MSREDDLNETSLSIQNQQQILEAHAKKLGFTNLVHFYDDGITGVRFERDGYSGEFAEAKDAFEEIRSQFGEILKHLSKIK